MKWETGWGLFKRKYVGQICGHETKLRGSISMPTGDKIEFGQKAHKGEVEYCLDCLGKMAIRCAWCGEYIAIGDPITLYVPKKNFKKPEWAVEYQDSPDSPVALVGCLRWDCADTGAARSGFWMPSGKDDCKGKVHRVMSPLEMIMNGHNDTVFIGDACDIQEAERMTQEALEKIQK